MAFGASPIFSDSFTRANGAVGGKGKGWTGSTSDFAISSNRLVSTGSGYGTKFLRCPQPTLNDQRLKCTLRTNSAGNSLIAVVRGSTTQVGGYICWLSGGVMNLARLPYGGGAGSQTTIDTSPALGLSNDTDYVLTMTAEGTTISATLATAAAPNTILDTVSGTDATYSNGVMGFLPLVNDGQVDNFEVYSTGFADPTVIIEGDSFATGIYNDFPTLLATALTGIATVTNNISNGGDTIGDVAHDDMTSQYAAQVGAKRDFNIEHQFVVFLGGTNDVYYGASGATTYSRLETYCDLATADGFKIIVFTMVDRTNGDGSFDTNKNAFNTSLRADYAFAFGLADVAENANLGGDTAAENTSWFPDGVHPSNLGAAVYVTKTVDVIGSVFEPTITVDTPVSSDIALVGIARTITWTSALVDNVNILLSLDGGSTFPLTIVSGTASDGSYSWTPTQQQVGATVVIKVIDADSAAFGVSEQFKVATTEPGGSTNTALWFKLQEFVEIHRP